MGIVVLVGVGKVCISLSFSFYVWFDWYVHLTNYAAMLAVCIGRASSPQMVLRYAGGASAAASAGGGSGAANSGKKEYYDPVRNG